MVADEGHALSALRTPRAEAWTSALINGTVDIANASREMRPKEIEVAQKNGVEPVKPKVLLMDEPCSALDPAATAAVEELIWELRGRCSILIVTPARKETADDTEGRYG